MSPPPQEGRWRLLSPPVLGWIAYDFASTIFSFVVVTRYFGDWIVNERGQPDLYIGLMTAAVSVAVVFTLPAIGAFADRRGRHKPVLIAFALMSVACTALLGVIGPVWLALVVAGLAILAFNCADSQYHPLLAVVAPESRRGRVSGTGVAVGYLGTLSALFLIGGLVEDGHAQRAFLPAAAMFGLFALPCFLLVREGRGHKRRETAPQGPFAALADALRRARRAPHGRLLMARFLYVDAIATVIQFMVVYARRTGDFDGDSIDVLLGLATLAAISGALGSGLLAERIGPKRVILGTLAVTVTALVIAAATGAGGALWVAGPMVGAALGSLSTVDRLFMLRLVPPERRGEDFGLYALVGKLSSGFGPLVLWGGTIYALTALTDISRFDASRVAIGVLACAALAGALVLRGLREPSAA